MELTISKTIVKQAENKISKGLTKSMIKVGEKDIVATATDATIDVATHVAEDVADGATSGGDGSYKLKTGWKVLINLIHPVFNVVNSINYFQL